MIWLIGAMIAVICALLFACAILKLHEWDVYPLRALTWIVHRPLFELFLIVVVVAGLVQYGATKGTNGNDRVTQQSQNCLSNMGSALRDGESELSRLAEGITNLCFTGIGVSSNMVALEAAWPTNLFVEGTILDYFAKPYSLKQAWQWIGACDTLPGTTNLLVTVDAVDIQGVTNLPSAMFFKVQDRSTCATTMADADGDGLPDVYELQNGTNPYVSDYDLAPKITVGSNGDYGTIGEALSHSAPYSIVALPEGVWWLDDTLYMPEHPVLLTGPDGGYAVIHSASEIAVVMLDEGQGSETYFKNLYLVLEAEDNFQAGFWVGGNLPWSGQGASPKFENVRIRAMYPDTLYYGWHYYRDNGEVSLITNCVMNAAGTTSAIGVYCYNGPTVDVTNCSFVNFASNDFSCAEFYQYGSVVEEVPAGANTNLSWAGYSLAAIYSNTIDSDGDGLSDYEEIRIYDTDPWLVDSDGDGLSDAEEVEAGTNPCDLYSFFRRITLVTTASDGLFDVTNYVAWGVLNEGWETNDLASCAALTSTNHFSVSAWAGTVHVKAYRDLNRNGEFDADDDILLVRQVPPMETVSFLSFSFGDVDGDGINDVVERQEGTNPYDKSNKCFNMALSVEDVPRTTNSLTARVTLEGAVVCGPIVVTGDVFTADLGHQVVTNGGAVVVKFWDDANGDSLQDTNEWSTAMLFTPAGHENVIVKQFDRRNYDSDSDGIPDWWEMLYVAAGVSSTSAADAFVDADADGLINYLEYWTGCDPAVPDGSNTLISVCSRSVDDRIRGIAPSNAVDRFVNFFENAPNGIFIPNANFWLRDVDVSCVSVWNNGIEPGSMMATAITRRHVIMAAHWHVTSNYTFVVNGQAVTRHVERTHLLAGSDMLLGRLNDDLPEAIHLPMVLSTNLLGSITSCKYLPGVCINNRKAATILELDGMNCDVPVVGGGVYHQMGKTSAANVVSSDRVAVRSATVVGNSSSPVFLLIGEELIFLFSKHLGYKGIGASTESWGPVITYRLTVLQGKINEWEGEDAHAYQINVINSIDNSGD